AEGGMRDALSILDQAISYSEEMVQLEDVLAVTGGVSQHILTDIANAMFTQDVTKALTMLDEMIQTGKDPGRFVYDLIYFMRDLLLYKSAPSLSDMRERAHADESFQHLAEKVSVKWIQQAIAELNQCQQEIKWTNSPKVFIEITLLSITNRYEENNETASEGADSQEVLKLTGKLAELEKEIALLKQQPQGNAQPEPTKSRRPKQRTGKNSYKI